jgi:hypothetical protein
MISANSKTTNSRENARSVGRVVLADCEQSRCGHGTSSDVKQEYAANVVREVYADDEFSGSVNQQNHSPQQTRNEEVVGKDCEPAL